LKDLTDLPRPEELRALVAAREPEQMEMLELDTDGLPLSLAAGAPAGGESEIEAVHVAGDTLEASDAGEADEDDDDDDEFEGDDQDEGDDEDDDDGDDDAGDDDAGDEESERPSASFAKRPSR
jgi:hypothetical protein